MIKVSGAHLIFIRTILSLSKTQIQEQKLLDNVALTNTTHGESQEINCVKHKFLHVHNVEPTQKTWLIHLRWFIIMDHSTHHVKIVRITILVRTILPGKKLCMTYIVVNIRLLNHPSQNQNQHQLYLQQCHLIQQIIAYKITIVLNLMKTKLRTQIITTHLHLTRPKLIIQIKLNQIRIELNNLIKYKLIKIKRFKIRIQI